jgi:hypothetical protein
LRSSFRFMRESLIKGSHCPLLCVFPARITCLSLYARESTAKRTKENVLKDFTA